GQDITIDDLYTQTSMNYPAVYRLEFTGKQLKDVLEDVCDNLFNKDPFLQQGGDMVRVGGVSYTCAPKNDIGNRISNLTHLKTASPIDPAKKYVVAGWASVNENVTGPAIYDLMEKYISERKVIDMPKVETVKVVGM
ncbi:MAG: 5'-nucleotidase C-terminal domain-containing protein, partial [Hyphomicrobiaceae bacterium]